MNDNTPEQRQHRQEIMDAAEKVIAASDPPMRFVATEAFGASMKGEHTSQYVVVHPVIKPEIPTLPEEDYRQWNRRRWNEHARLRRLAVEHADKIQQKLSEAVAGMGVTVRKEGAEFRIR